VALKATNGFGVAVCVLYLIWRRAQQRAQPERPSYWKTIGVMSIGMILVVVIWQAVVSSIAILPSHAFPMTQRFAVKSLRMDRVVDAWSTAWSPLRAPYIPSLFNSVGLRTVARIENLVVALGVVAALFFAKRSSRERALASATAIGMMLFGPAIVLVDYYFQGVFAGAPPRYALSILPAALAVLASVTLRPSVLARTAAIGAVTAVAVTLAQLS
jgi:hypothetical protein